MATSVYSSGSQTATISTTHQLGSDITDAAVYILEVDMSNLANGDVLELTVKKKVRTSDSLALQFMAVYSHGQSLVVSSSPPIASATTIAFYLRQTAGTGRTFSWSVLAV